MQHLIDQTKSTFWKVYAHKTSGNVYWDMGKGKDAFKQFDTGIKIGEAQLQQDKTDSSVNFALAYIYSASGIKFRSLQHINLALMYFDDAVKYSRGKIDLEEVRKSKEKLIVLKKEIDAKKYPPSELDLHLKLGV